MELKNKFILDACCGMRYMWYNKQHPNTLYIDIRKESKGFNKNRPFDEVNPDIQADFAKLPMEIKEHKFKLIVWDVPHFKARKLTGNMLKCFGGLHPETWQSDLKNGFNELWYILDDFGVLLFKFSDYHIKFENVISLFPQQPLFYNMTNSTGKSDTKWFCFMKIPKANRGTNFTKSSADDFPYQESLISVKRESADSPNSPQTDNKLKEDANFS